MTASGLLLYRVRVSIMKKSILVLLTLVPVLAGYLINTALLVPVVGMLLFYILPFAVLIFWFWLGSQYSKTNWGAIPSILIGSATGIVSLALYLWQFVFQDSETRNLTLAGLSQMYSIATPMYLTARLAALFETQPNYIGRTTATALQAISLILMSTVFTAGFFWGRNKKLRNKQ